jgi:hypothetical protein
MLVPEFLYQLSGRDQQVTWLDPRIQRVSESQASVSFSTVADIVPEGRALILLNASLLVAPGGAQTVNAASAFIAVVVPNGPTRRIATLNFTPAGAEDVALNWVGQILLPPGWGLLGGAAFNLGVAANVLTFDYFGVLIPVGNIQRV